MKVEVYRNLHKKCYSVRFNGKVIKHIDSLIINNPTFAVQPAGNRKVRETGRKNVHAFIRGDWDDSYREFSAFNTLPYAISYNPYEHTTFINRHNGEPIYKADCALLHSSGVAAWILQKEE